MLELRKRYTSPETGTWIEIVEWDGATMKFERSFAPGSGRADPHLHQDLTQTWEGLSGEGRMEVAGGSKPPRRASARSRPRQGGG